MVKMIENKIQEPIMVPDTTKGGKIYHRNKHMKICLPRPSCFPKANKYSVFSSVSPNTRARKNFHFPVCLFVNFFIQAKKNRKNHAKPLIAFKGPGNEFIDVHLT